MASIELTTDNFQETISRTGTVIVDCWAAWCGPCRAFAPVFEAAAGRHPTVTFAKVDTDAQQELAGALEISAIPTIMVFRDGVLLFRHAGGLPPAAIDEILGKIAEVDMDEVRRKIAAGETGDDDDDDDDDDGDEPAPR